MRSSPPTAPADAGSIAVRVSTDSDAEAIAALRREQFPYFVTTPASLRHHWRTEPAAAKALRLVAEADGEIVALGRAAFNTWTAIEGAANLGVLVGKDHRGRGVGTGLYDRLMDRLLANGATRVEGWGDGDEPVRGYLERRGFERRHELRYSHLDPRRPLPPMPEVPQGVRAVPFAEAGAEEVFRVDAESVQDEPGDTPADSIPFEHWSYLKTL